MSHNGLNCTYKDITLTEIITGPHTKVLIQLTTMYKNGHEYIKLFNLRKFRRLPGRGWFPLRDSGSGIAIETKHGRNFVKAIQQISEKEFGFKIKIVEVSSND